MIRLCGELLDYDAKPQIRELLGISYFMSGRMQDARQVFMDLTAEDPGEAAYSIYLGMTEELQHALAGNIVYFCGLMSNKWYRPLFLEFITYVKERGFLAGEEPLKTLKSAFSSWESYAYHEDRRICSLMETFLNAQHNKCYMSDLVHFEEERDRQKMEALVYEWYLCQYAQEHWEEIEYIRETYPRTYADNAAFFEKVKKDKAGTEKTIEEELLACTEGRESLEKIHESMLRAYERALKTEKEPTYVYDGGDTYRRMQPKVGRNDPCPCGSGKKYKKCCGR